MFTTRKKKKKNTHQKGSPHPTNTNEPALMTILGGVGTLAGPVIGALIALPLREFLVEAFGNAGAGTHQLVYGLLLVVIVVLLPQGLQGGFTALRLRWARRRAPAPQPDASPPPGGSR
jgi:branched-chain amino acid transport system permease protein